MAQTALGMSSKIQDVAIVGMSCLYPGAPNLAAFWENILAGVDAVGDPPAGLIGEQIFDPDAEANDRLYTLKGGYVGDLISFDPTKFGVIPRSIDGGEPEHFVALQLAHDALADAGYLDRTFDKERTEIILGRGTYANRGFVTVLQHTFALDQLIRILAQLHPEHTPAELAELKARLKASLPPFNAETAASLPHSVMCGRIANRLDLMGPAYSVDAACASALIAADLGMKDLATGACDLALVGAVQISTSYPIALLFSQLGALSRSGRIRPFHAQADGTLLGEGAGVVVLKRLTDAEADGDRIYAVLKGIGTSSDGRAMGLLAPRLEGEELAMRRAYANAEVSPDSIGLVEAHGTATPLGDETELTALRHVFGPADEGQVRRPLGSVKSMIGHCIPAAGAAGLIKTALAVYHRVIPPTLHTDSPHPALAETSFYLPPEARPWIHGASHARRAAVSAFGFGGINGHAILEEHSGTAAAVDAARWHRNLHARWPSEVILVGGDSAGELCDRARGILEFLRGTPKIELRNLAYTLNTLSRGTTNRCLAVVATDPGDLGKKLEYATEKLSSAATRQIRERSGVYFSAEPLAERGRLAFLFPGEGSQYTGMLADLCIHFPEARAWFDLMDRAFQDHERGTLPSHAIFPLPNSTAADRERLWQMDGAIEAVFAANQAMHAVLSSIGLVPDVIVGHSTGEYSALLASGAARVEDQQRLVEHVREGNRATDRAQAAGLVPDGVLLAVGPAEPEVIRSLAEMAPGEVYLAMDNCPHQAVLWGTAAAIDPVERELRQRGAVCQKLPFSRAYHTPLFAPVCAELEGFYTNATFAPPAIPLYSCVTAAKVPDDPAAIQRLALEHWASPVRFRETIEAMHADGARLFVEVGPAANLTAFVNDILRQREHLAIASNTRRRSGLEQLNHLIGMLCSHGVEADLAPLYERRGTERLDAEEIFAGRPAKPAATAAIKLSLALPEMELPSDIASWSRAPRAAAGVAPTAKSLPSHRLSADPSPSVGAIGAGQTAAPPPADLRAAVMHEYMGVMERFLETQEEILGAVLRGRSGPAPQSRSKAWPLANARIEVRPDGSHSISCRLSLDTERFLLDHTLGGTVSVDAALRALPVFPLAMSLEMMAQAASCVQSAGKPDEIRDLKVHRWLAFVNRELEVEIIATPGADRQAVDVQLFAANPVATTAGKFLTVSGTIVFHEPSPPPPAAGGFALHAARTSRWSEAEVYAEGQSHGMFHGPLLRGVLSLDRVGDDGIEGTLRKVGSQDLIRQAGNFEGLTLPTLVDAVSQLVGFWTAETFTRDFVVFPTGFDRLQIFRSVVASEPGGTVVGRARCSELDEQRIRAELQVVDGNGNLLIDISGWEVGRAPLPEVVYAYRLAPSEVIMSQPLAKHPLQHLAVSGCRLELPENFLAREEGIWLHSLAHLSLGPAERHAWSALNGDDRARRAWFLRQMAAKDAMRLYLQQQGRGGVYPADLDLAAVENRQEAAGAGLAYAVSQRAGATFAVAGTVGSGGGLGIDCRRSGQPLDADLLSAPERALLQSLPEAIRRNWLERMACAKDAGRQALARAGHRAPETLEVSGVDIATETLQLSLGEVVVDAATSLEDDFVVAIAKWEGIDNGRAKNGH